ncbi:efflux RND transporter periplasmic adaptor subunit [bacterium]|nr:efflux RND transporter periplasmic adaptor subunit [bacterium]
MKKLSVHFAAMVAALAIVGTAVVVGRPDWVGSGHSARPGEHGEHDAVEHSDSGEFCPEHGVPERFCTKCDPSRMGQLELCSEHGGIPEAICTLCDANAQTKYGIDLCPEGHGLPREFCAACGTVTSSIPDDGWCATHKVPESECLDCAGDTKERDARECRQPLPQVRLAGTKLAERIDIRIAEATKNDCFHALRANAEVAYDANRYADISPRVSGFLKEVVADLGDSVKRGDTLAVVDSPEISSAKAQFLNASAQVTLAQATYDRTKPLARAGTVPGKTELETLTELTKAKALLLEARQKLKNFGFDEASLRKLIETEDTDSKLPIVAPIDGVVVARHAVQGEHVEANTQLFAVTDVSRMWLWINVYQDDVAQLSIGQKVVYTSIGSEREERGTLNWIGAEVDPKTRTLRARASLENPDGRLRANQYGIAKIIVSETHPSVQIPKEAVQSNEGMKVVFLPQDEEGVYRTQRVVTRPTDAKDRVEVAWGLKPGDRVVTTGSFLLKTEIMKGAIGAGCAH